LLRFFLPNYLAFLCLPQNKNVPDLLLHWFVFPVL
jgi:hypothetical protein